MRARDRIRTVLALAILGTSITAATPAVAQEDSAPSVASTYDQAGASTEEETSNHRTTSAPGTEAGGTPMLGAEHIALLALAVLSIGAAIVTIVAGKRRVLAQPE